MSSILSVAEVLKPANPDVRLVDALPRALSHLERTAGEQPGLYTTWIDASLILLPDHILLLPPLQVGVDLGGVAQIVAEHGIHIGEADRRVLVYDLFRSGAIRKGGHHRIEGDAGAANPHDAVGIDLQWDGIGYDFERHRQYILHR